MRVSVKPSVILIEDDLSFAQELVEFLEAHGLTTSHLVTLDDLWTRLRDDRPDLLILDQFVAGNDSLPYLGDVKSTFTGGVVVLTGNQDRTDRVVALESGADDFIAKSLDPRELLARLRAVLRRSATPAARVLAASSQPVGDGTWQIDTRRLELRAPSRALVPLTRTEFQAMLVLVQKSGHMITRDCLSMMVLERPFSPLDRSVDNMISRIRKALEPHLGGQPAISSVRGKGYVFDAFSLEDVLITDPTGVIAAIEKQAATERVSYRAGAS